MRSLFCGMALLCILAPSSLGEPPADISKLIQQLGSDDFAEREAAHQKLEALGEKAFDALRKAAADSDDPEVKDRARRLLRTITAKGLRDETKALQGVWKLAYVGEPGAGMAMQESDSLQISFTGSEYAWKGSGFLGFVETRGRFTLGQAPAAKTLDLHASGRGPQLVLYAVQGDALKLCLDITQDHHRPSKLANHRNGWPMLLTFARASR